MIFEDLSKGALNHSLGGLCFSNRLYTFGHGINVEQKHPTRNSAAPCQIYWGLPIGLVIARHSVLLWVVPFTLQSKWCFFLLPAQVSVGCGGGRPCWNIQCTWKDKCLNESLGDEKHLIQSANNGVSRELGSQSLTSLRLSPPFSDVHHFLFFHLALLSYCVWFLPPPLLPLPSPHPLYAAAISPPSTSAFSFTRWLSGRLLLFCNSQCSGSNVKEKGPRRLFYRQGLWSVCHWIERLCRLSPTLLSPAGALATVFANCELFWPPLYLGGGDVGGSATGCFPVSLVSR